MRNQPVWAGVILFAPAAGWLCFYILYWQMHFPLLYLAAALCIIPAVWASATLVYDHMSRTGKPDSRYYHPP